MMLRSVPNILSISKSISERNPERKEKSLNLAPNHNTRFGEHKTQRSGPVRKHFETCARRKAEPSDMSILHKTTKSIAFLETLEALYIRELNPALNTRDEWRSRELTILV